MAPSIEMLKESVAPTNEGVLQIVLDDSEPFNPELFYKLAQELNRFFGTAIFWLKYIVRGNRMILFKEILQHATVSSDLEKMGFDGDLNSAGEMEVRLQEGGIVGTISGYSRSLESILPSNKSYEYREKIIKPALGRHFNFR